MLKATDLGKYQRLMLLTNRHKNIVVGALLIVVLAVAIAGAGWCIPKAQHEDLMNAYTTGLTAETSVFILIGVLVVILALVITIMAAPTSPRKAMGLGVTINILLVGLFVFVAFDQLPRLKDKDNRDSSTCGRMVSYIQLGLMAGLLALSLGLVTWKVGIPKVAKATEAINGITTGDFDLEI